MTDQNDSERRKRLLMEMIPGDWDKGPISLGHEISRFLDAVKDEGTSIDSGTSSNDADLWVKVGGIEYYINIRRSNAQLAKDGTQK